MDKKKCGDKTVIFLTDYSENQGNSEWKVFVDQTYSCLAADPISREDQGQYEVREPIEN
ncbi:MAG: hypothetical protein KDE48_20050 [Anaerolineales bacterium]|nr:hypothetical protein [Anaerolineales bacterium]